MASKLKVTMLLNKRFINKLFDIINYKFYRNNDMKRNVSTGNLDFSFSLNTCY